MKRGIQIALALLFSLVAVSNSQNNMAFLSLSEEVGSASVSWNESAPGVLDFQLVDGMILLEASIDGVEGCFILDTGSPGLVVNQVPERSSSQLTAYGPTGAIPVSEVLVRSFELGGLTYQWLNGLAINLSHLEPSAGCSLGGLVGSELFKEFDLLIDYKNQQLAAFLPGTVPLPLEDVNLEFPLIMTDHLPVVAINIQGKNLFLGLDTGSGANILDGSYAHWVEEMTVMRNTGDRIRGLNQEARRVKSTWLWMNGKGHSFPEPARFLMTDLSVVQQQLDVPLDGLLGYPFFKDKKVLFSFSQEKILVWH